jgi:hypothetical protein
MNPSFRSTLILILAGVLAWSGWYGWQSWKTKQTLNALEHVVRSADLDRLLTDPPAEIRNTVDLAIRGIKLSQGSKGRKTVQLHADWAALNQDSGAVTVREPDVLYMLRNGEDGSPRTVHAISEIGRVEDGNQKISMSGSVRATHEDKVLTGDLAVFHNQVQKLTFPGGADLNSPELQGHAAQLTWDLNTNVILGDHGVKMRWYPSARQNTNNDPESGAESAAEASK